MPDSDAFRKRRSRKHAEDDHSLCIPGRCAALDELDGPVSEPHEPHGDGSSLGVRGQRLLDEVSAGKELAPTTQVMLLEACRIVDRLDRLDEQLRGGDWLRFRRREDDLHVVMQVDRSLSEAREQATALRGLLTDIESSIAQLPDEPAAGGVLADFAARLEAKRRQFVVGYSSPDVS